MVRQLHQTQAQPGSYDIVLSGVTEPAGGNYEPLVLKNGTLTISARPSSGGSSGGQSSGSTPTYPVSSSVCEEWICVGSVPQRVQGQHRDDHGQTGGWL